MTDKYARDLHLTATEISIIRQALELAVLKQRKLVIKGKEPYLATLKDHLKTLEAMEKRFYDLSVMMEDEVLNDIK